MSDLIQLCGGNMGKGTKIFYQGIAADAITQAAKYKYDKIYVPNPEIFTALGFNVSRDSVLNLGVWEERVKEKFKDREGLYKHQMKGIPEEILTLMSERGILKKQGKKYIIGTA